LLRADEMMSVGQRASSIEVWPTAHKIARAWRLAGLCNGWEVVVMRGTLKWAGALAVLAFATGGCASQASTAGNAGVLTVTVQQIGGPILPNGTTPTQAVVNAEVKVAHASGVTVSAATNHLGVATFSLAGGSYYVSVATCGPTGKSEVTVKPAGSATLTWVCPVP
jgi:hypothetical protein